MFTLAYQDFDEIPNFKVQLENTEIDASNIPHNWYLIEGSKTYSESYSPNNEFIYGFYQIYINNKWRNLELLNGNEDTLSNSNNKDDVLSSIWNLLSSLSDQEYSDWNEVHDIYIANTQGIYLADITENTKYSDPIFVNTWCYDTSGQNAIGIMTNNINNYGVISLFTYATYRPDNIPDIPCGTYNYFNYNEDGTGIIVCGISGESYRTINISSDYYWFNNYPNEKFKSVVNVSADYDISTENEYILSAYYDATFNDQPIILTNISLLDFNQDLISANFEKNCLMLSDRLPSGEIRVQFEYENYTPIISSILIKRNYNYDIPIEGFNVSNSDI